MIDLAGPVRMDAAAVRLAAVGSSGTSVSTAEQVTRMICSAIPLQSSRLVRNGTCMADLCWNVCGGWACISIFPFHLPFFYSFSFFSSLSWGRDLSPGEERLRPCFRLPAAAHVRIHLQHRHELTHDRIAVGLVLLFPTPLPSLLVVLVALVVRSTAHPSLNPSPRPELQGRTTHATACQE